MRSTLALVLGLLVATPALAGEPAGRVSFLEGGATRLRAGEAASVEVGSSVEIGDGLETSAGARLEVVLADGSVLRLDESSRIVVEELTPSERSWKVRLSLALGTVWAKVTRRVGPDAFFRVTTERVVAGVRGTEFLVQAKEEHLVEVFEGRVEVGLVEGGRYQVSAMELLRVDAGGRSHGVAAAVRNSLGNRGFRGWIRAGSEERLRKLEGGTREDRLDRERGEEGEGQERDDRRGERKRELRQRTLQKRELVRERLRDRLRR